jgi:tetratricopeptide (TPR) repeat protein
MEESDFVFRTTLLTNDFGRELKPEHVREHFERAWVVLGETSGRAMRSLSGYFFAREEYAEAVRCLRRAVTINPLFSRSWFILGCACIREEDWEGAREAFVCCVTIDDEDAESWNNLASVYLRMKNFPGKNLSKSKVRQVSRSSSLVSPSQLLCRPRTMTMTSSSLS